MDCRRRCRGRRGGFGRKHDQRQIVARLETELRRRHAHRDGKRAQQPLVRAGQRGAIGQDETQACRLRCEQACVVGRRVAACARGRTAGFRARRRLRGSRCGCVRNLRSCRCRNRLRTTANARSVDDSSRSSRGNAGSIGIRTSSIKRIKRPTPRTRVRAHPQHQRLQSQRRQIIHPQRRHRLAHRQPFCAPAARSRANSA